MLWETANFVIVMNRENILIFKTGGFQHLFTPFPCYYGVSESPFGWREVQHTGLMNLLVEYGNYLKSKNLVLFVGITRL